MSNWWDSDQDSSTGAAVTQQAPWWANLLPTAPTPANAPGAPTNMWNQRPSGVGGMPGPQVTGTPAPYRPEDSPSFTAPNPYGAGMPRGTTATAPVPPSRPVTPTPTGPRTPASAGPAAVAQQPNLGSYNPFTPVDRPNMSPQNSAYGRQGAPQMTALDLSSLFRGGQPAAPTGGVRGPLATPDAQATGVVDPSIVARQKQARQPKNDWSGYR